MSNTETKNQYKGITKDEFYSMVGSIRAAWEKSNKEKYPTINSYLRATYASLEDTTEFNSFKGWKDKGFKVKKGEKAYRVFSAPKKMKIGEDKKTGEDVTKDRFFQACIFSENQVEKIAA